MRHSSPQWLAYSLALVLILLSLSVARRAQDRPQDLTQDEIGHHERILADRTRQAERVRVALARTSGEIQETEGRLSKTTLPMVRTHLEARLESLRMRLLRRNILQQRAELKQIELAEYLEVLKKQKDRPTPLIPAESRAKRQNFLARRLTRAETLLKEIRDRSKTVVSDRGKKSVSRLIGEQQGVIAAIKRTIAKVGEKGVRTEQR